MDKPKTILIKSKSSNTAITTKSESRKNKKSRSNGEFQRFEMKKRGVYVEKKPTQMSINEQELDPATLSKKQSSHRPIPRPGRKRFLASVLTILSQSTTGTQYPDHNDPEWTRKLEKHKTKLRRRKEEEIIQENLTVSTATSNSSKKRQKYRSKVLNNNDSDFEQLVVLKSTKEITHTPSNYSEKSIIPQNASSIIKEPETFKWSDILPPIVKSTNVETEPPREDKEVQENPKEKIVRLAEKEPSTLVAEVPKKDDKKLYNFFVDLLETTFNVYNVKTEFHPPPPSTVASSKVALEIDESVAKKLNIEKNKDPPTTPHEEVTAGSSSRHFYSIRPEPNEPWDDDRLLEHFQPKLSKRSRTVSPNKLLKKRRLQSESFEHKKSKPIPATSSLTAPSGKTLLKRNRKKNFINMLKKQLKMEDDAFEEPQNFYQALKVIARNKRRCQKSIHFREPKKVSDENICQFKRRRLLSASTKSSKKSTHRPESDIHQPMRLFTRDSDFASSTKRRKRIDIEETSDLDSSHSLEVLGFDYDDSPKKIQHVNKELEELTSEIWCVQDYNNDMLLKYYDSGNPSFANSRTHIEMKHG